MSDAIIVEKAELLRRIEAGYTQLETLLASLDKEEMIISNVNGNWSVKDNITHLIAWQDYLRVQLQGVLTGKQPVQDPAGNSSTSVSEDEENEEIYQQNKDRSLDEVLSTFRSSYQQVLETVRALSEEHINAPLPWSEKADPIWPFIAGNTYGHYEDHIKIIQDWRARS